MDSRDVAQGYDAVAAAYAAKFGDELSHKPFDRWWLDRFDVLTRGSGRVCDLGCGPGGQVGRYLHERGADVFGADVSHGALREARQLNPGLPFEWQDMLALDWPEASLGGVVAFYAIVHFDGARLERALAGIRRALKPGGWLLMSFHIGDDVRHVDELLGEQVSMDFAFFQPDDVIARMVAAGLSVEEVTIRYPYPDVEYPSKRGYILASRPAEAVYRAERAQ